MKELLKNLRVRDTVIVMLTVGSIAIAIVDPKFREFFGDLAQNGLTGYFALAAPNRRTNDKNPPSDD